MITMVINEHIKVYKIKVLYLVSLMEYRLPWSWIRDSSITLSILQPLLGNSPLKRPKNYVHL